MIRNFVKRYLAKHTDIANDIPEIAEKFSMSSDNFPQQRAIVGGFPYWFYNYDKGFNPDSADRSDANFSRAVRLIGDSITGLPIILKEKEITDQGETYIPVDSHPILDIIHRPNDFNRFDELTRMVIQALMVRGNGFQTMDLTASKPTTIWPTVPGTVEIALDKQGLPKGYNRSLGGVMKPIDLDKEAVIHYRFCDMRTPFNGASLIPPIKEEMTMNANVAKWHSQHFADGAHSDIYLKDNTTSGMTADEKEQFAESWATAATGLDRKKKNPLIPKDIDLEIVNRSLKDMAYEGLSGYNREQILALAGIPPSVAGIFRFANYANALIQDKSFWQYTLIPMIRLVELTLQHQLFDKFYAGEDLKLFYDISGVAALQEDGAKQAQRLRAAVGKPYMLINEARAEINLEPIDGGDELSSGGDPFVPQEERQSYISDFTGHPMAKIGEWLAFDKRTAKSEEAYKNLINKFFRQQLRRIIDRLNQQTSHGAFMSTLFIDNPQGVFDLMVENEELEILVEPFMKRQTQRAGNDALRRAGISSVFNVNDPYVIEMIGKLVNRSKKINDATYREITDLLSKAYGENWSHSELVKEIYSTYKDYGYARARMIARTEMAGVMNGGAEKAYKQAGVKKKEWLASLDGETRDAHAAANGQVVEIDQPFNVGGEMLTAPGDPGGSAAQTINCRCTVLPVV